MKRICPVIFLVIMGGLICRAQPPHTFTHYTGEDGLSQKTVQSILQDHKGLMWFATWDGLFKFDGYTFKNYKAHGGDGVSLSSNRINNIKEDKYGYIWMMSYDDHIFRFSPRTEIFEEIPCDNYAAQDFYVFPDGDIWVVTAQAGLIHVGVDPSTHEMDAGDFFETQHIPNPGRVNRLHMDREQCIWLLTDNGLYRLNPDGQLSSFFVSPDKMEKQAFYEVLESGDSIWFTSGKGCIWRFEDGRFSQERFRTSSAVKFIKQLKGNRLFIGTDNDGFFLYSPADGSSSHYTTRTCRDLRSDIILDAYVDSHGGVWLRHEISGVTHFVPESGKADYFILHDNYGRVIADSRIGMHISEDANGSLWIRPCGGGFAYYDRKKNQLLPFYNPALQSSWNIEDRVTGIFTDRQGNLWFCSYNNGLQKVTFDTNRFHLLSGYPDDPEFSGNNIRAVFQDRQGYIWAGSKDKTVRLYDRNLKYIGNLTRQGNVSPLRADKLGAAYSFTQDHAGTVWIGTKGDGLIAADPVQGSAPAFRLRQYRMDEDDIYSLTSNDIYSVHEDSRHRLWLATFGAGLNYADLDADSTRLRFINYRNRLTDYPIDQCYRTRVVKSDSTGRVWIGSTMGLLMFDGEDVEPEQIKFHRFSRIPSDASSLSYNDVYDILFTKGGEMYITTLGGGLNRLLSIEGDRAEFKSYTTKDGFPSDALLSMEEDRNGNLWFSAEEELCKFNPETGVIENYNDKTFPARINFNEGSALKTQDGRLLFNTVRGVFHFSPDSISTNRFAPPIVFTSFMQEGQPALPILPKGQWDTVNIDDVEYIELPHNRNSFTIQFAALDMKDPNGISYAYRLEGFENNWNDNGGQRTATYTNLPKGSYTLHVRSTNGEGVWVDNTRSVKLTVLPSFWETPWAFILYGAAVVLVIFAATYILFTFFRLKQNVSMEQQMSEIKLHFFTDISHELRTPLTLIAGPIEQLLQDGQLNTMEREQLTLVEKNTRRMLRLVNQILDLRKIQSNKMNLRVQLLDLIPFTGHLMENFHSLADEYQIDFRLETDVPSLNIWADADKLEQILFNLLSNAFKYTSPGKEIKVVIADGEKEVSISVEDQGIGIAEDKQPLLFVRFESLVDKNLFNQKSTGIGLSLVKELVEMHHGSISLQSRQGEGSRFTVKLPKGKEHFDENAEFILSDLAVTDIDRAVSPSPIVLPEIGDNETDTDKETILIVEDNTELRSFLKTVFMQLFNVLEAENGEEGLEKSRKFQPDIVVSDVMMPKMNGIEMTKALRDDICTSHIYIVLLTAKSNVESMVEGMQRGADDYITKPFSIAYLKARILNLLEQRKRMQALYCSSLIETGTGKPEETPSGTAGIPSPKDRKFMDKVLETIETNMGNSSLQVEDLASGVNMSRSVFFKKLKTLTGLSPIDFLKEVRMKRASELLESEECSISQISYMVGFNDPHYFSKCFRQQYGITATEYRESRKSRS